MPEFADREKHERRLASTVAGKIDAAREAIASGGSVNLDQLATDIRNATEEELAAIAIIIFLMMADSGLKNRRAAAEDFAKRWARDEATQVSSQLAVNIRRELAAGRDPATTLSPRRAEVLAATEVTRAVTAAETAAREANAFERAEAEGRPPATKPDGTIDDGLTAIWNTREDERVCPICGPWNEKPESKWRGEFPEGPPAHPNCRCYLTYDPAK